MEITTKYDVSVQMTHVTFFWYLFTENSLKTGIFGVTLYLVGSATTPKVHVNFGLVYSETAPGSVEHIWYC